MRRSAERSAAAPRIPPPPPGARRPRRGGDGRWATFALAFAAGVALGVAAYEWLGVAPAFDYWLTLALGA